MSEFRCIDSDFPPPAMGRAQPQATPLKGVPGSLAGPISQRVGKNQVYQGHIDANASCSLRGLLVKWLSNSRRLVALATYLTHQHGRAEAREAAATTRSASSGCEFTVLVRINNALACQRPCLRAFCLFV